MFPVKNDDRLVAARLRQYERICICPILPAMRGIAITIHPNRFDSTDRNHGPFGFGLSSNARFDNSPVHSIM